MEKNVRVINFKTPHDCFDGELLEEHEIRDPKGKREITLIVKRRDLTKPSKRYINKFMVLFSPFMNCYTDEYKRYKERIKQPVQIKCYESDGELFRVPLGALASEKTVYLVFDKEGYNFEQFKQLSYVAELVRGITEKNESIRKLKNDNSNIISRISVLTDPKLKILEKADWEKHLFTIRQELLALDINAKKKETSDDTKD